MSNTMMRNIMGQTVSGFNLRDIMDGKKILLVNLSKGKMGELNSKLLGMIFVMKFQAAAMGRAHIPEDEREDFSLFVDEFQNFATESFETILSEARKYRLNLVLGNQFMTQLTDKIREAIIGNVGTVISGRIGVTDAELMVKKFQPVFDAEDLTKLPNYQAIVSVMINGVPSAPFSMSLTPPLNQSNSQLADAMKRLSSTKYGHNRGEIEKEIFTRLEPPKPAGPPQMPASRGPQPSGPPSGSPPTGGSSGGSFLDDWLAKRQKLSTGAPSGPMPTTQASSSPMTPATPPAPQTMQQQRPMTPAPQQPAFAPQQSVPVPATFAAQAPSLPPPIPASSQVVPEAPSAPASPIEPAPIKEEPSNDEPDEVSIRLR
jgi:hypothetical protein